MLFTAQKRITGYLAGSQTLHQAIRRIPGHDKRRTRGLLVQSWERLEDRCLLATGYATPTYVVYHPPGGITDALNYAAVAYTPAQIRHAYGFDKISFNGVAGDGTGETIAIVDAYDDPRIASDLHGFDVAFGLPDPTFTKVNETGGTSMPSADAGWSGEIALDVE